MPNRLSSQPNTKEPMSNSQLNPASHLQKMYETLHTQSQITPEDWQQMVPHTQVRSVPAKYTLQSAGANTPKHHFLAEGLVRLFYTTPEGKELNKGFYGDGYIVGSLSALILNEPCRFAVETIEPSVVIELPIGQLKNLIEPGNGWDRLMNYSFQMMLVRNERREAELLTMTAKQRFLQFVRNFPDYLERIPQYHIASYLGITPVALSKYKKQWLKDAEV